MREKIPGPIPGTIREKEQEMWKTERELLPARADNPDFDSPVQVVAVLVWH